VILRQEIYFRVVLLSAICGVCYGGVYGECWVCHWKCFVIPNELSWTV